MLTKKDDLLKNLRECRKKFGREHVRTYKAIYRLVKEFPYYDGYEESWLQKNGSSLK